MQHTYSKINNKTTMQLKQINKLGGSMVVRWLALWRHRPFCVEFAWSPRAFSPGNPVSPHDPKTCLSGELISLN